MSQPSPHTVASLRDKNQPSFFRKHFSFLLHWDSLFYFALFSLLIAFGWIGYSLFENSFTQMLNWDYTWQYVPFSYTYWDAWHVFFTTGTFPQYDFSTWIGTDAVGSNSYYGLFDPFTIALVLFPRSWVPQMMAVMTAFKVMTAVLLTRCYLRYMGIKEWTARWASLAAGLSGFVSFFVGFPSFVSAAIYIPMILWGIERVIREKKAAVLIWALFLEGITSFFFLVVVCIFGVIYALWRYFWTLKTRSAKDNWTVIIMGVCCFVIGLLLCSFTLLPSIRESSLSGRSSSIGTAYLNAIKTSLKSHDLRSFFSLVFEPVGDHPGREFMGLLSFFFPTAGHVALPLARSSYDAWTASLFCYTPCVILFFASLIHSIRLKRIDHLLAVLLVMFLVFTNFSYFFFYAFSGNGYGRWYIILIPLIVYYCAWGFDQRESSPRWISVAAGVMALGGTLLTFFLSDKVLKGVTFDSSYNPNNLTYWPTSYVTASETYNGDIKNVWYLYYQLALVTIDAVLMCVGQKKKWLPKALVISVAVEAIVMGNIAYAYDGLWYYSSWFANGGENRETMSFVASNLNERDKTFFRTYADAFGGTKYSAKVAGLNGSAEFHSLMNFDTEDFSLMNQMKYGGSTMSSYGTSGIYNASWAGYYANKREGTDMLLGYRYYEVSNSYSAWKNADGSALFLNANVPFDSVEIEDASPNRDLYRVYGVPQESRPSLGWAVDSDRLYRLIPNENSNVKSNFYSNSGGLVGMKELLRAEDVEMYGAMIAKDEVLPDAFDVKEEVPSLPDSSKDILSVSNNKLKATYYTVGGSNLMIPSSEYFDEGLGYFLNRYETKKVITSSQNIVRDSGMVTFTPSDGTYFNADNLGTYFELKYYNNMYYSSASELYNAVPRVYVIGDVLDDDGVTVKEANVLMSFEYNCFDNARKVDSSGHSYYGYSKSTFGLYAQGAAAKAVVFCFTGSKTNPRIDFDPTNVYLATTTYQDWKAKMNTIQEDKLQDVTYSTNVFTFHTAYAQDRVVVTQLGYDKGWQATATLPNGTKQKCQMMKLDGGLVGFVAPSALDAEGNPQTVQYELRYTTPYANYSAILWAVGALAFSGYLAYAFASAVKDEKKKGLTPFEN